MLVAHVKHFPCSVGPLLIMARIGRNMQLLYFIIKNIVAIDKIQL
jgi:hypothetical protein